MKINAFIGSVPTGRRWLEKRARRVIENAKGNARVHLGCGEVHMDGYLNVDFPPSAHPLQSHTAADMFADIRTLDFPPGSFEEVRLHHVFEHFDRPTALVLAARWRRWLKDGGLLRIEVPDFDASARQVLDPALSWAEKSVALRHLFGSHEAVWAYHLEGWNAERFRVTLGRLGYTVEAVEPSAYKGIRNITALARATGTPPAWRAQRAAIEAIMAESLVDDCASEKKLLTIWMDQVPEDG